VKEDNQLILLNLQSRGPKALDIDLLGTEGDNPYAASG